MKKIKKTKSDFPANHYHFNSCTISSFPARDEISKDCMGMIAGAFHPFRISRRDAAQVLREWRKTAKA
jgi:hypothetical protein